MMAAADGSARVIFSCATRISDAPSRYNRPMHIDRCVPKKPFPCYDGIRKTTELYDSNEMRRYAPEDFYDDSLVRETDASGFIDRLYQGS